jgi:hypothetical protein
MSASERGFRTFTRSPGAEGTLIREGIVRRIPGEEREGVVGTAVSAALFVSVEGNPDPCYKHDHFQIAA